ncbi:zinc metalloproteinase nas-4 [Culex quinquefasciatus]|uniref:zinc metalloproteinase nas-4 n=1 Tax=Culex quinquefasciatus TaxID=7176 RepID=UPI0018E3D948|nr:zinc metalloproteinase nas-4 [Culex quinquefasciatus]
MATRGSFRMLVATFISVSLICAIFGAPLNDAGTSANVMEWQQAGKYFQGDMVLNSEQTEALDTDKTDHTALIGPQYLWPQNTVYYVIKTEDFTAQQQAQIKAGMAEIEANSCIKFVPRTTQKNYVYITGNNSGCWAVLGYQTNDINYLNLNGCWVHGSIVHELLHTLGFVHMQSSSDRDFYVTIDWSAIQDGADGNFVRYWSIQINDLGVPYDYESVMHYGATAFGKNGQQTIIPHEPGVQIGLREKMSFKDIKRLNKLYPQCN